MATGKRYYWIKLSKDFLNSEVVDFLLSQKNGAEYVVLYLKLCMMCINTQGKLEQKIGEVIVPFDAEKIQRDCKYFSKDTVIVATQLYRKLGLIYEDQDGALVISNFDGMVGSATDYALQKRNQRANNKPQIEGSVDNVHSNVQDNVLGNVHTEYRDKSIEIRDKSIEIETEEEGTERSRTDYQKIVALYHSICKSYPEIKALSENRKKAIRARLKTYSIDDFETVFKKAESSDFMKGGNNRNWSATFDWMLKDANFAKILDGNYDNKEQQYTQSQAQPQRGFNSNDYLLNIINGNEVQE